MPPETEPTSFALDSPAPDATSSDQVQAAQSGSSPPATPEPAQAAPAFREQFGSFMGLDTSGFTDDDSFKTALSTALQENESERRMADLGRQFAPVASEMPAFLEWQKQQRQPSGQPSPALTAEPAAPEPELPEYDWSPLAEPDPRLLRVCERDPNTGLYRAIEGHPEFSGTAAKLNEAEDRKASRADRLVNKFPDCVKEQVEPLISKLRSEIAELKAAFTTSQERQESREYRQQRAGDFYQHDDQGNIVLDPQTSQPLMSPVGETYQRIENTLGGLDLSKPEDMRLAVESYMELQKRAGVGPFANVAGANGQRSVAPAPVPATGPAAGEVKRQQFIDRAIRDQRSSDRAGTIPDATAPEGTSQNPEDSFRQHAREAAREAGASF